MKTILADAITGCRGKAVFSAQQHRKEAFIAYLIGGEY